MKTGENRVNMRKKSDLFASVMVFGAISRLGKSELTFKQNG
jgi:hypothetical protein